MFSRAQIKRLDQTTRSDVRLAPIPGRPLFTPSAKMIWNPTAMNECAPSLDSVPGGSLDSFSVASSDGKVGVSNAGLAAHLRPADKWGMQPNIFDSPEHAHVLEKQVRPHPTLSDAAYPEPPGWLVMAEAVAEWLAPAPPKGRGNAADTTYDFWYRNYTTVRYFCIWRNYISTKCVSLRIQIL